MTCLGGLTAVGLMAMLSAWSGHVLVVAPLGASCVLLFGYPRSPLAQPRNVVLGNCLGGCVGIALVHLLGQGPLVLALAVALTILMGQQLRCLHPPAGGLGLQPLGAGSDALPAALALTTPASWAQLCRTTAMRLGACCPGHTQKKNHFLSGSELRN
jgi:CBS-domain-containing membrane protein